MEIYQIDDDGQLFIGPDIDDWTPITAAKIDAILDMDGGLDDGVHQTGLLYLYFPFEDKEQLPDPDALHSMGIFGAGLIQRKKKVLSHCGMGHNRSALVAGTILYHLGFPKEQIVDRIQARRKGALYNRTFREYLEGL